MLYLAAIFAGLIIPLQSGVNRRLGSWLGSPFFASFVSFIVAAACLGALMCATTTFPTTFDIFEIPTWQWLGGILGVVAITANIYLLIALGGVQQVVFSAAGQVIMGLIIDACGLFEVEAAPLTPLRLLGAALVIGGICFSVAGAGRSKNTTNSAAHTSGSTSAHASTRALMLWRLLGIAAGVFTACQTAINGRLGTYIGSSIAASFASCIVGIVLLGIISICLAAHMLRSGEKRSFGKEAGTWWMWIGGVMGATMICLNATLAPALGAGTEVIFALAGSILGGLIIDMAGLFGVEKKALTWQRICGIVVLMIGAVLIRSF